MGYATGTKIVESLRLFSIVCVLDQEIYSKAIKVEWKEKEKFKNDVLVMGMFHTIRMYMHILSKRFSGTGLHDVFIQSSTTAEQSMDKKAVSIESYNILDT